MPLRNRRLLFWYRSIVGLIMWIGWHTITYAQEAVSPDVVETAEKAEAEKSLLIMLIIMVAALVVSVVGRIIGRRRRSRTRQMMDEMNRDT